MTVSAGIAATLAACGSAMSSAPPLEHAAQSKTSVPRRTYPQDGVKPSLLAGYADAERLAERRRMSGFRVSARPLSVMQRPFAVPKSSSVAGIEPAGSASTLVLYDGDGSWSYLGELYAVATANLCGHFGPVTIEPVSSYRAGQIVAFSATVYIGSQYSTAVSDLPAAFYDDAFASTHPVLWLGDNIWNYARAVGLQRFEAKYGWDPTSSFLAPGGSVGRVTRVRYNGQELTRSVPSQNDPGMVHPSIVPGNSPAVTVVATAVDSSTVPQTTFPWALRSNNLTYIGEIPFTYVGETDRVIALEDLVYDQLAPFTTGRHRALVRFEDIDAADDMVPIRAAADYLYGARVPFGFNVIPQYEDPLGAHNNGLPRSIALSQSGALVSTIRYLLARGGTLVEEGYTHQYGNLPNPYSGASGDDAEFFLAHRDANADVVWDGPVPATSAAWAQSRIDAGLAAFQSVALPQPKLWVTPHYFATDVDYRAIALRIPARYERSVYYAGIVSTSVPDYARYIGQFFPYVVTDVYGTKVIPENLGDYQPLAVGTHPARVAADLIAAAQDNLAVRDGFASFFYNAADGLGPLQTIVTGIQGLGYTFVDPGSL
jgi:uncharacterized protein YdaL